ncbi:MAG: phytanoyl-CoA dioxygenase family protein [Proteobacteria bacterium]|nr:phytanoyl-CoA dioxygenase family protein [Pseudomonadota bacterium]
MEKKIIRDMREYFEADLATKYKSTAGSQEAVAPEVIESCLEQVERQGYVIIENLLSPALVEEIRRDVVPRLTHSSGRNTFEGFRTQRLYAVIEKTSVCNDLVAHPLILGLLDRIFQPNYLLSQLQVINILPGEDQQPWHYDDGFYAVPRPRPPLGAATIWAIDDFTAENGATVVIPGSHKWVDRVPDTGKNPEQQSVVMPAGSVIFFIGTLWHGGGQNRTDAGRLCVTAQYCAPWCRQQENFSLSVSRDRVKQCSEHIQRLLGYSIHPPFMGFVNGMHPKRLLE